VLVLRRDPLAFRSRACHSSFTHSDPFPLPFALSVCYRVPDDLRVADDLYVCDHLYVCDGLYDRFRFRFRFRFSD
jgi:hypothetical protein